MKLFKWWFLFQKIKYNYATPLTHGTQNSQVMRIYNSNYMITNCIHTDTHAYIVCLPRECDNKWNLRCIKRVAFVSDSSQQFVAFKTCIQYSSFTLKYIQHNNTQWVYVWQSTFYYLFVGVVVVFFLFFFFLEFNVCCNLIFSWVSFYHYQDVVWLLVFFLISFFFALYVDWFCLSNARHGKVSTMTLFAWNSIWAS